MDGPSIHSVDGGPFCFCTDQEQVCSVSTGRPQLRGRFFRPLQTEAHQVTRLGHLEPADTPKPPPGILAANMDARNQLHSQ